MESQLNQLQNSQRAQYTVTPATDKNVPEPVVSDYVQVTYLTMFFLLGAPINLAAYVDLKQNKPNFARCRMTKIQLLKRHLNFSDLMVILIYTPSQIVWLLTYSWYGGDALCRIVKFFHNLSFQISSNIIVCIALDRLISIFPRSVSMTSSWTSWIRKNRVMFMLMMAWLSGVALSCPLLVTYTVFAPYKNFEQCVTVWQRANFVKLHSNKTANLNVKNTAFDELELIYGAFNLLCVFWIPMAIVTLCYFMIFLILKQKSYSFQQQEETRVVETAPANPAEEEFELNENQRAAVNLNDHKNLFAKEEEGNNPDDSSNTQRIIGSSYFENETALMTDQKSPAMPECEHILPKTGTLTPISSSDGASEAADEEQGEDGHPRHRNSMIRQNSVAVNDARRQQLSAMRISIALVIAYAVCWLPYNILSLWEFVHRESYVHYSETLDFVHGLVVLNSVVNPFIYGMFGRYSR